MNLANALSEIGDLARANASFEEATSIAEAVLGPSHPMVALCLESHGVLLYTTGDRHAARTRLERALILREAALGPDHPSVAQSLVNLSAVLRDAGDTKGAVAHARRALEIRDKTFGRASSPSIRAALELAQSLAASGSKVEAIVAYDDVRERANGNADHKTSDTIAAKAIEGLSSAATGTQDWRALPGRSDAEPSPDLDPDKPESGHAGAQWQPGLGGRSEDPAP